MRTFSHTQYTRGKKKKPVLVMAGGQDRSLPLSHVRASFDRLAGKKFLRYTMGAGQFFFSSSFSFSVVLMCLFPLNRESCVANVLLMCC